MSRTIATVRLYTSILALVALTLWGGVRETLPSTEDEAGQWLAGFCHAFIWHWVTLIAVTWWWAVSR